MFYLFQCLKSLHQALQLNKFRDNLGDVPSEYQSSIQKIDFLKGGHFAKQF